MGKRLIDGVIVELCISLQKYRMQLNGSGKDWKTQLLNLIYLISYN